MFRERVCVQRTFFKLVAYLQIYRAVVLAPPSLHPIRGLRFTFGNDAQGVVVLN